MVKYCSGCGTEIGENDEFCKGCGKQLIVEKINKNQNITYLILVIAVIAIAFFGALYFFTPETRTVGVSVPYQEAIYETRYSGTLKDTGLSTSSWTIKDATSYTPEYTGKDFWGSAQYTINVCWKSSCIDYPQINDIGLDSNKFLIGYQTKYRTEYNSVTKTRLEWLISG